MASRFENCVAALVAKGTISDADAQGVLAAFKNHRARGLDDAAAAVEAGAAALRKSAELRAQRAEEILRTAEIVAKAESYQHGFGPGAHAFLLPEEIDAAFAICRQRDFRIMAHAGSTDTVRSALFLM